MSYRKANFVIRNIAGYPEKISIVSGWTDEREEIGFYKRFGEWVATDLASGTLICKKKTRLMCAIFIKENYQLIKCRRDTYEYFKLVSDFRTLILEEKKKLNFTLY